MSPDKPKRIGLIIGRENDWPNAFMEAVNQHPDVVAELVKIGGTFIEDGCPYDLIIDRTSHEVPYYRIYVEYAALHGAYVINNPFTWSVDNKFFGTSLTHSLGLKSPRTVVLPNKELDTDTVPDSFRNLLYPMDWQGIIDHVGVPAIFKEVRSGGRRLAFRVHSVEELIQQYDESGARTMILQELIESDEHIHCFVVGQKKVLPLRFSFGENKYYENSIEENPLYDQLIQKALMLSQAYAYDINMVEFVVKDGTLYVINSTNPSPLINRKLMTPSQFEWIVRETVAFALECLERPSPQRIPFDLKPPPSA
jgi:glutathione synthase/RimK-type ligase-like ATP-grasp enzyme